jgi:hypothetical protein
MVSILVTRKLLRSNNKRGHFYLGLTPHIMVVIEKVMDGRIDIAEAYMKHP